MYPTPFNAQINSPEAIALRQLRQQRRNAPGDPLAKREQLLRGWHVCPWIAKTSLRVSCRPFYINRTFFHLLLPKLAAYQAERKRAARAAVLERSRADAAAWTAQKEAQAKQRDAARKLAKKLAASPVRDLFGAAA